MTTLHCNLHLVEHYNVVSAKSHYCNFPLYAVCSCWCIWHEILVKFLKLNPLRITFPMFILILVLHFGCILLHALRMSAVDENLAENLTEF